MSKSTRLLNFEPRTHGVTLIDCEYLFPNFASAYLVVNQGKAAFIDNNTANSVPLLMEALRSEELKPEAVEYIIITHVHLDHAGGTSALLKLCRNATVLAHPRAAPHVIDPSKLITSARKVYGDEKFEKLYGTIEPIAPGRVRTVADDEIVPFGKGEFQFLHTRGHANHHTCVLYRTGTESAIFTGDAFGIAYPDLQGDDLFIFPSTSPTDFIADEAIKSVERIASVGAQEALLTHFGSVRDFAHARRQMIESIQASEQIVADAVEAKLEGEALEKFCLDRVYLSMGEKVFRHGMKFTDNFEKLLALDLDLNAQGLAHVVRKTLLKKTSPQDAHD